MSVTITVNQGEVTQLITRLNKLKDVLNPKKEIRKIFIQAARPIVNEIKQNAPVGATGALKNSVGVIPYLGSSSGRVFVGIRKDKVRRTITAFYATFLEFGTRHIRKGKFAFFERSASKSLDQAQAIIATRLRLLINKFSNG